MLTTTGQKDSTKKCPVEESSSGKWRIVWYESRIIVRGGGLGDFGFLMAGCEIVFQVEIDEYCQKILALRYPDAKRFRDIREVNGKELPKVDIITGGFPCQPFSVAGNQDGKGDNRYLWPQMSRIISEVGPSWVVAENVPGIIDLALDDVLDDLESKGYETVTLVFPAHAFGAPHRRDRVWIVGYAPSLRRGDADEIAGGLGQGGAGARREKRSRETGKPSGSNRRSGRNEIVADPRLLRQAEHEVKTTGIKQCREDMADTQSDQGRFGNGNSQEDVSDTDSLRSQGRWTNEHQERRERQVERPSGLCDVFTRWWEVKPPMGGTFNGYPVWLDQHITKEMSAHDYKRTTEILRGMWNPVLSKTVWQTIGGLDRIQKAEILLSIVCRNQKSPDKARVLLESQKAFEEEVRSLWAEGKIAGSSFGSDDSEQQSFKHPNALQKLSRILAHNLQENWSLSSWEDGISRLTFKATNRVNRLKCLGNGQVSLCTKWIAEQIIEYERMNHASE